MHFHLQLDPGAEFLLRQNEDGTFEILITEPSSENSTVIELSGPQVMALRDLR
ncbi:hypothetical protein [Amycolatopsis sp. YIM 10]|uniref:hypothetical protein n=1 Tax=Amycolatopsis sp. YIM 10 TaxID=2653857 RepID=UPI00128FDE41|nr:hypothetical protein [Amycolatopsis sp. YIM 10]QFU87894.1 hypothetical protein YIM_13540 [Amycolatopsis sp. YIM 10]QFU94793.1 hypothetical protein YIM_48340 [Amycolatopsis sp. YIM 10]